MDPTICQKCGAPIPPEQTCHAHNVIVGQLGGRPPKPTVCADCGAEFSSFKEWQRHWIDNCPKRVRLRKRRKVNR